MARWLVLDILIYNGRGGDFKNRHRILIKKISLTEYFCEIFCQAGIGDPSRNEFEYLQMDNWRYFYIKGNI